MTLDEVRRAVGHGVHRLMEKTVPGGDVAANVQEFLRHHPSVVGPGTRALPEVSDVLSKLHAAGIRLAVCSNKPLELTQRIVQTQGWRPIIDAVLGPESAGRPKPEPDMLLLALEQLGAAPEEALYVGDMAIDVETARNAGVRVWVLPTGSHTREQLIDSRPDRLLEHFSQLQIGRAHV